MAFITVIRAHDNMKFNVKISSFKGDGINEKTVDITRDIHYYYNRFSNIAYNIPANSSRAWFSAELTNGSGQFCPLDNHWKDRFVTVGSDLFAICDANRTTNEFYFESNNKHFSITVSSFNVTIQDQGQSITFQSSLPTNVTEKHLFLGTLSNCPVANSGTFSYPNTLGFILETHQRSDNYHEEYSHKLKAFASSVIVYSASSELSYEDWTDKGGTPPDDIIKDNMGQGGFNGGGGIGAGGTFDDTSDLIEDDELPSASLTDIGFVTLYTPTINQLRALAQFMWSRNFFDNVLKAMSNLFDCIIGIHILPFKPATSGSKTILAGNIPATNLDDVPITSLYTNQQFQKVECGSVTINEYYGNYLDYAPYTSIELSLPFIGSRAIDVDEVMGKTLTVRYKVDIATGAFVCVVMANGTVLYQFTGTCAVPIPVSGLNYSALISDTVRLAVDVGKTVATSGASAGALVTDTANMVGDLKPAITRSGNLGGASGFLAKNTPYLIIKRPRMSLAKTYIDELGYPCNASYTLGSLSGYTRCEKVELKSATATSEEYAEIERMLCSEGVLL